MGGLRFIVFLLVQLAAAVREADDEAQRTLDARKGVQPQRMIVLSNGRGGSTVLCKTLAQIGLSNHRLMAKELFGENMHEMAQVSDPTQLMSTFFDEQRRAQPTAHLVGFKWKSLYTNSAEYEAAWKWVAAEQMPVLFMTRNALAEVISAEKHSSSELSAHCGPENTTCLEEHLSHRVALNATTLVQRLDEREAHADEMSSRLARAGVRALRVTFEDLFAGEATAATPDAPRALRAWNQALSFLGEPTASSYASIDTAIAKTGLASTDSHSMCDSLLNVEEVRSALGASRHAALLEC